MNLEQQLRISVIPQLESLSSFFLDNYEYRLSNRVNIIIADIETIIVENGRLGEYEEITLGQALDELDKNQK